jgi:hypothetical protein
MNSCVYIFHLPSICPYFNFISISLIYVISSHLANCYKYTVHIVFYLTCTYYEQKEKESVFYTIVKGYDVDNLTVYSNNLNSSRKSVLNELVLGYLDQLLVFVFIMYFTRTDNIRHFHILVL